MLPDCVIFATHVEGFAYPVAVFIVNSEVQAVESVREPFADLFWWVRCEVDVVIEFVE